VLTVSALTTVPMTFFGKLLIVLMGGKDDEEGPAPLIVIGVEKNVVE
jgi:hypothetical protein